MARLGLALWPSILRGFLSMGFFDDIGEDTITVEYLEENGWENLEVFSTKIPTKSSLWTKQIESRYRIWTFGYDMENQQLTLMKFDYPSIKTTSVLTMGLFINQKINAIGIIDLTRDFS